jgi:dTDP-4-dehydrorhamnose 3,5-epimerase
VKVTPTPLDGVLVIEPRRFGDARGFFLESYEEERYRAAGIDEQWVQDNHSRSAKNVLRGLHFTKRKAQAQLLTVMRGRIFDVVVDVRRASPTRGRWFGTYLSDDGVCQVYMAHGFAHGFCVLSDFADLHYKVTQRYDPHDEGGLRWNDPDVGIEWPIREPIVSDRDQAHPLFRDLGVW